MKIFIDAGHNNSGWNTGATGNGLREQDITFEIAKALGLVLSAKGLETKLSRPTKETNLGTSNTTAINLRWQMANEYKADYFISIHCNSVANSTASGAEVLYYKPDSLNYAAEVLSSYIAKTGLKSRGVKYRNDLAVIKNTNMPAVLVELAFISNPSEANFMKNNIELMAQGLAEGIFEILGIKEEFELRYDTINDCPDWAKPTIKKLIAKGFLKGDGKSLDLSADMIRMLVINDQAGLYGA